MLKLFNVSKTSRIYSTRNKLSNFQNNCFIMDCKNIHRLSRSISPINYAIKLTPNFDNWTFLGTEVIKLNVEKSTNQIVLNSFDIVVKEARYNDAKAKIDYDTTNERVMFGFDEEIKCGEGQLHLEFTGNLNDEMRGFYRSTYKDDAGEIRKLAVTHFEPADARRAFPCFDEPIFKATFDIKLVVEKGLTAISNSGVASQKPVDNNLIEYTYETTPRMSTYLVAIAVGPLDRQETQCMNGKVNVGIYTAVGKSERGTFALNTCARALEFYSDYFKFDYPLKKLDMIAVPDFAIGAMENWGLVTYRETALLIDKSQSDPQRQVYVSLIVCHETAHMWFGNLVTMEWWTDLWLKEGFASFVNYPCVNHIYPNFGIWTRFLIDEHDRALSLDSLTSSHPIEVEVGKPTEIDEIFDAISYSKGASLLRMICDTLGDEKFKSGLASYLQKYKYSNAVTANLWQSLSEATGADRLPVAEIMNTWTKQMGFPVVEVSSNRDAQSGRVTHVNLKQRRYLASTNDIKGKEQYWLVPVTICEATSEQKILNRVIMKANGDWQSFELPSGSNCSNIKINPGGVGFFHTQYQESQIPALVSLVPHLGPQDRLAIIEDQFALANCGAARLYDALLLIKNCASGETNFDVLSSILRHFGSVKGLCDEIALDLDADKATTLRESINQCILEILEPIYKQAGWVSKGDGSSDQYTRVRPMLLSWLGKAGHQGVIEEARRQFEAHRSNAARLEPNLRMPVFCTVLASCQELAQAELVFSQLLQLLDYTDLQEERLRILNSLSSTRFPELQKKLIAMTLNTDSDGSTNVTELVRKQDKYRVIMGVARDAASRRLLWKCLCEHWTNGNLAKQIPNNRMLGYVFKDCCSGFARIQDLEEVEKFFCSQECNFQRAVEQMREKSRINIDRANRFKPDIQAFFKVQF